MDSQVIEKNVNKSYEIAKEIYASYGVDTDSVLERMKTFPISMHCWQGDDVTGFEGLSGITGGGILATGNYPGRARNGDELRQDMDKAMSLIPGKQRLNLHAMYAETDGKKVDRDEIEVQHFSQWIEWAKERQMGIDFNPTFFSHKFADDGYTLSSKDSDIRSFWIRHGIRSREIAQEMGKVLGSPCVNNIWIPDGSKDTPANRLEHRLILKESLDEILKTKYDKKHILDAVECKLFGIGSESYVVGSHEFYMGYGLSNDVMICLDAGHFHPTETIADKISALLVFQDDLLLHVSRGVRWDSDHVVIYNDDTQNIAAEIKRCNAFDKVHVALDFFDASISRITAWVVGTRAILKAIMAAMLEPTELLMAEEDKGNFGNRLALMEEFKSLPVSAVWNKFCSMENTPVGSLWLDEIKDYEDNVLSKRI
jgi:L-rhamnose isomerase